MASRRRPTTRSGRDDPSDSATRSWRQWLYSPDLPMRGRFEGRTAETMKGHRLVSAIAVIEAPKPSVWS